MEAIVDAVKTRRQTTLVVHVSVKRMRELALRLWIGCKLIWLAALIMNCGVEIKTAPRPPVEPPAW